jgi:hypothetical protein
MDYISVSGEPLVDGGIISYMVLGKDVANVQVEWAGEHTTVQGGGHNLSGLVLVGIATVVWSKYGGCVTSEYIHS